MDIITIWILLYLTVGAVALAVFDLVTKRIRHNLPQGTREVQNKLVYGGIFLVYRTASIVLLAVTLSIWPLVFIGLIGDKKEDSDGEER